MTPYRLPVPPRTASTVRFAEPMSAVTAVLLCGLAVCSVVGGLVVRDSQLLRDASIWWQSPLALVLFALGCGSAALASRREAWVILEPQRDRVLVVRRHALSVATSTLRLGDRLTAEYVSYGPSNWLVLSGEGQIVQIVPDGGVGAQEKLASALEEALTVRA
jgi:hypothetical protein